MLLDERFILVEQTFVETLHFLLFRATIGEISNDGQLPLNVLTGGLVGPLQYLAEVLPQSGTILRRFERVDDPFSELLIRSPRLVV